MTSLKISLFTPYYKSHDKKRQRELDECLIRNAENPLIDRFILLIDDGALPPLQSDKIEIRNLDNRPTYADWLSIMEDMQLQGPVLLANSDIYFDESLQMVHEVLDEPLVFLALSRWELETGTIRQHPSPHWSQDVWGIWAGRADTRQIRERLRFRLGVPRCDNKAAYVFATAGWSVRNPCNFLRSYHLQESQVRNYEKKADATIVGAVAYVEPSLAPSRNSALHFDVWTVKSHEVVKVTVNNSLEKWRHQGETSASAITLIPSDPAPVTPSRKMGARLDLYTHGSRVYANQVGMAIYEKGTFLLAVPSVNPRDWAVTEKNIPLSPDFASRFFKPVLDGHLDSISERPKHDGDVNFWQYPCRTEQQALDNHLAIRQPSIDHAKCLINVYVPLPWATYIDNKEFPDPTISIVGHRINFLSYLSRALGYSLRVHTVCQHIRWRNMLELAEKIGITDLHISHCTAEARAEVRRAGSMLRLYPWTLYAVNYCDKTRNQGLVVGKPMHERKYLASFIGAHMRHYLSDIRVRLYESLSVLNADDIIIELGDLWHFNQVVYDHQVARKYTSPGLPVDLGDKTERYNRVLSDSKFSLCPEGAGPNTLRLWESIAIGAVPVLFNDSLEYPQGMKFDLTELCLFWKKSEYGKPFYKWISSFSNEDLEQRNYALRDGYKKIRNLRCF